MSDWRERANKRRDERNTKISDESTKPNKAKKNTKLWCKGKVGREHTPKCMPHKPTYVGTNNNKNIYAGSYDLVCTVCGKVMDSYHASFLGWGWYKKKPDWVVEDE